MSLSYDFDVHDIIPDHYATDASLVDFKRKVGFQDGPFRGQVILFRNQDTIDAILAGPPCVVGFLKACGFGFRRSPNELPVGVYNDDDERIRLRVIGNTENAAHLLEDAHGNIPERFADGFSLSDFLEQLIDAVPLSDSGKQTDVIANALPSLLPSDAATVGTKPQMKVHYKPRGFGFGHAALLIVAMITTGAGVAYFG